MMWCSWRRATLRTPPRRLLSVVVKEAGRGRLAQAASTALLSAELTNTSPQHVLLRWEDGLSLCFHPLWLRDNCESGRHPATRQKLRSAAELNGARIAALETSTSAL